MSKILIAKLRGQRDELTATADALLARQEAGESLSDADKTTITEAFAEAKTLDERVAELQEITAARLQAGLRDGEFDQLQKLAEEGAANGGRSAPGNRPPSIGAAFTASREFTDYAERGGGGTSGEFKHDFALIKSTDGSDAVIAGVHRASDAGMPTRRTPLIEACGFEEVTSGSFDWIEWPVDAPAPGHPVDEGTPLPEASYPPVVRTGSLGKAGHHIPITEEFLQDNARMESIVSGALVDGVRMKAESLAGAALVGATLPTATHETLLKAIRRGVATVQNRGFMPSTLALNPLDYAEIDIDLLDSTLQGARRNFPTWGLEVVPAPAVAEGNAYVGDLKVGARVFARSQVQVKITDSHDDDFTSDILRLKATQRLSVKIVRPQALVLCTATVTP